MSQELKEWADDLVRRVERAAQVARLEERVHELEVQLAHYKRRSEQLWRALMETTGRHPYPENPWPGFKSSQPSRCAGGASGGRAAAPSR